MADKLRWTILDENGRSRPLEDDEDVQPPMRKIQIIKGVTTSIRKKYIQYPNDVVSVETLSKIMTDSKQHVGSWMHSESQETISKRRHACVRQRFRTYLFQMCGCYEFAVFWIRVRPSAKSLHIFKQFFQGRWHLEQSHSVNRMKQLNEAVNMVAGDPWEPIEPQGGDGARWETAK